MDGWRQFLVFLIIKHSGKQEVQSLYVQVHHMFFVIMWIFFFEKSHISVCIWVVALVKKTFPCTYNFNLYLCAERDVLVSELNNMSLMKAPVVDCNFVIVLKSKNNRCFNNSLGFLTTTRLLVLNRAETKRCCVDASLSLQSSGEQVRSVCDS